MKSTIFLPILIALILIPLGSYKIRAQQTSVNESISYCDLLKNPEKFDGKEVTLQATYRYGYEWDEIYCLECRNLGKTWLEIWDLTKKSKKILKKFPEDGGTVNAIFTGTFQSSNGPFGDGGYRFRLLLKEISKAEFLTKSGADPRQLPDNIRKRVCNN